ncbi:MAG TPA: [acyl-carrier-protein] S-malonyltransferase [Bdellovibrionales bacterium]|mgnify:CR=1 FL=1|nr:[acyl-carrier-protein] S-malonyltransferase [Pseudobdellovibrionaceae bacterium]HAG90562.1 [acyl-carrier-protein] S-malonyltransferase [Bdellovibrionales bacterium]|tara:strand:+ start:2602 stop:3573 length:972 start_codon:yes stop_codon:yes gene_type:complete
MSSSLAAIFPGQGSQHPGMGRYLYDEFSLVRELFEEASDAISVDFKKLCFEGSDADLALTENTQPCLLLVSTSSYQVLKSEFGFLPKAAAGHSIGEYAAVVAAEAMGFADGIRAVRKRGQAMQSAVPVGQGGMAAVMGLTPNQVEKVCKWTEEETGAKPLEPANFNAPGQIVISGKMELIQWVSENFKPQILGEEKMRVKFIPLKVSAPFHCSMMMPAQEEMKQVLSEITFQDGKFPVVQNVHGKPETSGAKLRENLISQVSQSVKWTDCMESLVEMNLTQMIECGAGQVLSGLNKKINGERIQTLTLNSMEELKLAGKVVTQ